MAQWSTSIRIGTAGWALSHLVQYAFPGDDSNLARYGRIFTATEINSSFHRSHRPATYARWADNVPDDFDFCVKVPKVITHVHRLAGGIPLLEAFLDEAFQLGPRLGCLLVQLPPSLAFEPAPAATFFDALRARFSGDVALEPRHASWFSPSCEALLVGHRVARVAADPARAPGAGKPGGWPGLAYWRLHGAPRIYWSSYPDDALDALADDIRQAQRSAHRVWCIFDNTASGAATANALALQERLT